MQHKPPIDFLSQARPSNADIEIEQRKDIDLQANRYALISPAMTVSQKFWYESFENDIWWVELLFYLRYHKSEFFAVYPQVMKTLYRQLERDMKLLFDPYPLSFETARVIREGFMMPLHKDQSFFSKDNYYFADKKKPLLKGTWYDQSLFSEKVGEILYQDTDEFFTVRDAAWDKEFGLQYPRTDTFTRGVFADGEVEEWFTVINERVYFLRQGPSGLHNELLYVPNIKKDNLFLHAIPQLEPEQKEATTHFTILPFPKYLEGRGYLLQAEPITNPPDRYGNFPPIPRTGPETAIRVTVERMPYETQKIMEWIECMYEVDGTFTPYICSDDMDDTVTFIAGLDIENRDILYRLLKTYTFPVELNSLEENDPYLYEKINELVAKGILKIEEYRK